MSSDGEEKRLIELISSDEDTDQIPSPEKLQSIPHRGKTRPLPRTTFKPPVIPHVASRGSKPGLPDNSAALKPSSTNKKKEKEKTLKTNGGKENDRLKSALKRVFKFDKFRTSLQEEACTAVLEGLCDVFVCMPTGAGQ